MLIGFIKYVLLAEVSTRNVYRGKELIRNIVIQKPASLMGNLEDSLNTKFNWTNEFIEQFQLRKRTEDQMVGCGFGANDMAQMKDFSPIKSFIGYRLKETCG